MAFRSDPQEDPTVAQIEGVLSQLGWRRQRGRNGRSKLRGSCLFHDDSQPSADFYPDDGWYYCHGCGEAFDLDEVAHALALDIKTGQPQEETSPLPSNPPRKEDFHYHTRLGLPTAVYSYRFPDGRLSHYKLRFQQGTKKTFSIQSPDGQFKKPTPAWPIFGDHQLPPHLNIVIVEGEKAQQLVTQATQLHQRILIVAITCGSANDLVDPHNRRTLTNRLEQLAPNRVLVWPDNDKPGYEWSGPLHRMLVASGIPAALVDVRALPLEHAEGCDDFIDVGGSLDEIFTRAFQQVGGLAVDDIVKNTVVTNTGQFLLFGTRQLLPIKHDSVKILHFRATGQATPPPKVVERLWVELASKSADQGVEVYYRRWHDDYRTQFAWRAIDSGFAYHVSAEGQQVITDPERALLLLPPGTSRYPTKVDESGTRQDLEDLCQFFSLTNADTVLIELWLLCALLGYQTPILLLRGEAGSAKTTLARALVGIIEPTVPAIELPDNRQRLDPRALIEGLRTSVVALIDNVSGLAPEAEDLLSRFVTGFSIMHRQLYENRVENLSMQRGIVITTTNWNVSKGDLSTRLVAIRMAPRQSFISEEEVDQQLRPLIEKVRGYLFKAAQRVYRYYQQPHPNGHSMLRIAGIGRVSTALGYDTARVELMLATNRGRVASETDAWFNSVVDWYMSLDLRPGQEREAKLEEIRGAIEGMTDQFAPSYQRFAAFLNEASPRFRDFGFSIERRRSNKSRFWLVTCHREMEIGDD